MKYLFLLLACLCFAAGGALAVWSLQKAEGIVMPGLLVAAALLLYEARWFYWKYEKPSVDAWHG